MMIWWFAFVLILLLPAGSSAFGGGLRLLLRPPAPRPILACMPMPTTTGTRTRTTADQKRTGLRLFSGDGPDAADGNGSDNGDDPDGDEASSINGANAPSMASLDALISASVDEDIGREVRGAKPPPAAAAAAATGRRATAAPGDNDDATVQWDVYVCQSKPCQERGSGATLDAFVGLAPPKYVRVHPAIINPKASRGKGPIVRILRRDGSQSQSDRPKDNGKAVSTATTMSDADADADDNIGDNDNDDAPLVLSDAFEVSNVDSVDKVYRILTRHMGLDGSVDATACECLRWNYRGNAHLERNEVADAIDCYDRAIATGHADQEGVVLLMRSTAYLKRSFQHQDELRKVVEELDVLVPRPEGLQAAFGTARSNPTLARALQSKVVADCRRQERQFRQIQFRHSLYEYALLHAAQDSLRATQLLPHYSKTWLRAGDALAELRKLREAARYYERAMEMDQGLVESLMPVVERLRSSQQFLDEARALGWPEDTLRLALDVSA